MKTTKTSRLFRLVHCPLSIALCCFTGCAVVPHGPVVERTTEYFTNRPDGLIGRVTIKDSAFSRGIYFFTDPSLNTICAWHTNAAELGGGSRFMAGSIAITVDTNLAPTVAAVGAAAGNVLGAAAKSALK
jgi:hypothetical protein